MQRQAGRPESAAFVSGTLTAGATTFAAFRRDATRLLYTSSSGRGMVPYDMRDLGRRRCSVVMLGDSRDELAAYGELQAWSRRER